MVYTEGAKGDPYTMQVYDIESKISTLITSVMTKRAAYFDRDGKIIFLDSNDLLLKKMNPDGTNIDILATPETPYNFDVSGMSRDREKIVIVEGPRAWGIQ